MTAALRNLFLILFLVQMSFTATEEPPVVFNWKQLPPIPDQFGFAGSFSGVSNGALIVAGGANFPDGGAPWTGSKKVWSEKIFVLETPDGKWKEAGQLPRPLGYGVSVSYGNKLICIGGSNAGGHFVDVFSVEYSNGKIVVEKLPSLPHPLANSSGAIFGTSVYLAGGLKTPEATQAENVFWSLDLSSPKKWAQNKPVPGKPRMLAVVGADAKAFYIFSGTSLHTNDKGVAEREYLRSAYKFEPAKGWTRIADVPKAIVAAPGPAYANGGSLYVFGGDDGELASKASALKDRHPGFSTEILGYKISSDTWSQAAEIYTAKEADAAKNPNHSIWAPVTTNAVFWKNMIVFPGGEVRPAVRTPLVLAAEIKIH